MLVIGLAGAIILIIAWLFETTEEIKAHKSLLDLKFALMNILGVMLLTYYSYLIDNFVFFWLNICIGAIIVFEAAYTIHITRKK